MNFRADRARQITRALTAPDFDGFMRNKMPALGDFVMLTQYASDIRANCAYQPQQLVNVLGEHLANLGKTQLRIAETEKYAHVTFFFNGGREEPFALEQRTLIPSPQLKTYDLKPEMSAFEVTDKLVEAITSGDYDAIICNYVNASVKAVEAVDICLGRIVKAVEESGAELLITADHGNVEQMMDSVSGQPLTSHTNGPVPLVYVGTTSAEFKGNGALSDLAPTLLTLLNIPIPEQMTGTPLLDIADQESLQPEAKVEQ
jgi:2,3-bisphosphoglycerate-independent phosphoglycerate mutase